MIRKVKIPSHYCQPYYFIGVSVEHKDASGFTQPHFDYVAGILTGHSVTSRDAYQMLGRVRYATELHLFIDQKFTPYIDAGTKKKHGKIYQVKVAQH